MKILQLTIENINSLYGRWTINFEDPEYLSNGIFLLTGPTGSGKTTVLDGICLALYGQTPRLDGKSEPQNVVSHGEKQGSAEVVFEVGGQRYAAFWGGTFHGRNGDKFTPSRRIDLLDENNQGTTLCEKTRETDAYIAETLLHMSFEQFTKTILLAQGSFNKFLNAKDEEKLKLFEQLVNSSVYREISTRVYERSQDEAKKLKELTEKIGEIQLLTEEELQNLQEEKKAKETENQNLNDQILEVEKELARLAQMEELSTQINELIQKQGELKTKKKESQEKEERLEKAQKAVNLAGDYQKLLDTEKELRELNQELTTDEEKLPREEERVCELAKEKTNAEKRLAEAKENYRREKPRLGKLRELLTEMKKLQEDVQDRLASQSRLVKEMETTQKEETEANQKLSQIREEQKANQAYFDDHAADQTLTSGFSGIAAEADKLKIRRDALKDQEKRVDDAQKKRDQNQVKKDQAQSALQASKQTQEDAQKRLVEIQDKQTALLKGETREEWTQKKEEVSQKLGIQKKIAELIGQLQDGFPCPLCGSADHPAPQKATLTDETEKQLKEIEELLKADDRLSKEIQAQKEDAANANHSVDQAKDRDQTAENNLQESQAKLQEEEKRLKDVRRDFLAAQESFSARLAPWGVADVSEQTLPQILQDLENRKKTWEDAEKRRDSLKNQENDLAQKLTALAATLDANQKAYQEKKAETHRKSQILNDKKEEKKKEFGEKELDPDLEEKNLENGIAQAEKERDSASDEWNLKNNGLEKLKEKIKQNKEKAKEKKTAAEDLNETFGKSLAQNGFSDRKAFEEARLSLQERESLTQELKELDDQIKEVNTRLDEKKKSLEKIQSKQTSPKSKEDLNSEKKGLQKQNKGLSDRISEIMTRLNEDQKNRANLAGIQQKIEAQQKETDVWEELADLIGEKKGNKFSRYAQGLTFNQLIHLANNELKKIPNQNRYYLTRSDQEFGLDVIDLLQGSEPRTTKNLSGGEGFVVSLALALGISKMASKNIRIDSLFLDEGFGTLDKESLENVLCALTGLQEDQKTIGIISHVPELQNRIPTQIQVRPQTGGRSVLDGPGVTQKNRVSTPVQAASGKRGRKKKSE